MNPDMLRLAVSRQAAAITDALPPPPAGWPTDVELELEGVPGYHRARIMAAHRTDGTLRAIITALDGEALPHRDWVTVDMPPTPSVDPDVRHGPYGVVWRPAPVGMHPEPQTVDATGRDVMAMVDTGVNNWELTCDCGRVRYGRKNNTSRTWQCRVCAQARRREGQTEWQRRARTSSAPTTNNSTTGEPAPSEPV